jgi:hypothetical protein
VADSPTRSPALKPPSLGGRDSVHLQASPLLLIGVIGGVISTVAVVISGILAAQPPGPGGGIGGPPTGAPPPPPTTATVALIISAAFFVISWVTVAAAVARDQLAQKIAAASAPTEMLMEMQASIQQLRVDAAADRANYMKDLMAHLETFGEQRETEGYLNAMRAAAGKPATNGDVRFLRQVPPPES